MRAHIFVDAENINPILFETSYKDLKTKYVITKVDVFSKKETLPTWYSKYDFNFVNCFHSKNSADTFMTAYIIKAVYEEALTDIFVVISQDNDLSPAIKVVTDNNKQAISITEIDKKLKNLKEIGINKEYFTQLTYKIPPKTNYFKAHIPKSALKNYTGYDMSQTIFIKYNSNITEIFFNNGMEYNKFLNSMHSTVMNRIRKGYSNSTKLLDILYENYLIVKNGRIYVDTERIWGD